MFVISHVKNKSLVPVFVVFEQKPISKIHCYAIEMFTVEHTCPSLNLNNRCRCFVWLNECLKCSNYSSAPECRVMLIYALSNRCGSMVVTC